MRILKRLYHKLTTPLHRRGNKVFHPAPLYGDTVEGLAGCFWNRPQWKGVVVGGYVHKRLSSGGGISYKQYFIKIRRNDTGEVVHVLYSLRRTNWEKLYRGEGRMQRTDKKLSKHTTRWVTQVEDD